MISRFFRSLCHTMKRDQWISPDLLPNHLHQAIKLKNRANLYRNILLWVILFGSLFVLVGPLALHVSYLLPAVKPRTIPLDEFSEERARDYYPNLTDHGPRVSGTHADYMARAFLVSEINRLRSIADPSIRVALSLQDFNTSEVGTLQNIAVRISNVDSPVNSPCVMLVAHYDSVEFSLGGSDDGSGVVILLEILSNLLHDRRITFSKVHLIVLFTAGEEMLFRGASAFITSHEWKNDIRRFINIDSTGGHEKAILFRVQPAQLIKEYHRVPRPHANVIGSEILDYVSSETDYSVFTTNGFLIGYDFAFYLDGYNYHTPLDTPTIVEEGALQHLGENTLVLTRHILLGDVDLNEPATIFDNEKIIYFDVLGRHLITYRQSTSDLIQIILICVSVLIGILVIVIDHFWHRKNPSGDDGSSVYFYFRNPLFIRLLFIVIFVFGYILSTLMCLLFSALFAFTMSKIRTLSWYGNSTLAFFLFGLPCCITLILFECLWRHIRRAILSRYPKRSPMEMKTVHHIDRLCFNFERHWALLLVYVLLMTLSIVSGLRSLYLIFLWTIFLCPIYCLIILIHFLLRWMGKKCVTVLNDPEWYWLFAPYLVALVPLIHTFEMTSRLTRLAIPMMGRVHHDLPIPADIIICALIVLPAVIFFLTFIPNLQKTMNFTHALAVLILSFIIVLIIACVRKNFNVNHPQIVAIQQTSIARAKLIEPYHHPITIPIHPASAVIKIETNSALSASSALQQISRQTAYSLRNITCSSEQNCFFEHSFNATTPFKEIELTQILNSSSFRLTCRHESVYDIGFKYTPFVSIAVLNQSIKPRSETIVDVVFHAISNSFDLEFVIRRCNVNDSSFLRQLASKVPQIVTSGSGRCQAVTDTLVLTVQL